MHGKPLQAEKTEEHRDVSPEASAAKEKSPCVLFAPGFSQCAFMVDGGIIEYARQCEQQACPINSCAKNFVFDKHLGNAFSEEVVPLPPVRQPCDTHRRTAQQCLSRAPLSSAMSVPPRCILLLQGVHRIYAVARRRAGKLEGYGRIRWDTLWEGTVSGVRRSHIVAYPNFSTTPSCWPNAVTGYGVDVPGVPNIDQLAARFARQKNRHVPNFRSSLLLATTTVLNQFDPVE